MRRGEGSKLGCTLAKTLQHSCLRKTHRGLQAAEGGSVLKQELRPCLWKTIVLWYRSLLGSQKPAQQLGRLVTNGLYCQRLCPLMKGC